MGGFISAGVLFYMTPLINATVEYGPKLSQHVQGKRAIQDVLGLRCWRGEMK